MTFTESNTVEALVHDILCGAATHHAAVGPGLARRHGAVSGLGWHYLGPQYLPRQTHEAFVEDHVREGLIRLNPETAAQPDRADDVLCRLRAIVMGVRTGGLVKADEEFAAWLAGERSMPFGADGEHITVRLVDLEDVERNQYVVSTQYTVRSGANEHRADLVLLVNGRRWSSSKRGRPYGRARAGSTGRRRSTTPTSAMFRSCSSRTSARSPPKGRTCATGRLACRSISGDLGGRTPPPTRRSSNGSSGPSRRCSARTWF